MIYDIKEIADLVQGSIEGDTELDIHGVSGIREAVAGEITFLGNRKYLPFQKDTKASAVHIPDIDLDPRRIAKTFIRVRNPYASFMEVVKLFANKRPEYNPGIHPSAVIGQRVTLGADVHIGANVVVQDDVRLGDWSVLMPGVFIGEGTHLGSRCLIYPNVSIMDNILIGNEVVIHAGSVIGSDGFGFAQNGNGNEKVPQVGCVEIGDNVEIGASVTVDRATFGKTVIGAGTKIDNLVQIAHNVRIGKGSILCAQVGISGSTEVGDSTVLAGQAGVVGHITIGNGAVVGAQAGVTKPVKDGECVSGYPARPHRKAMKTLAEIRRIPDLLRKVKELENRLDELNRELERKKN